MARVNKITEAVIERRWSAMQDHYEQRNANIRMWRSMYFLQHRQYFLDNNSVFIDPEPDEKRVVLPIAPFVVEGMRELLFTKSPAITVPVSTAKKVDQNQADHNEKALLAIWNWSRVYSVAKDSLWFALTAGWGVLETLWDKQDSDESPIVIIAHDPLNVYPCPGRREGEWKYVLLAWPRLVGEIRDEWELDGDERTAIWKQTRGTLLDLDDDKYVTYLEYWDKEIHAVAINYKQKDEEQGEIEITAFIKKPVNHKYGFLPWDFYFPCKLPFSRVGERVGVSIYYIIGDMIRYLCQLVSTKATMLERWQDPPLVTHTIEGRDFQPVRTQRGMHLKLDLEESAEYLVNPTPMPQIDSQIALLQDYIERGSIPRVLQGQYVGAISGIAMSLLRNPTLMKVAFKQSAIEEALVSVNQKILRLLEDKLGSTPLYAWGVDQRNQDVEVEIDPNSINNYYRNAVRLSASLPTDDASTVNMLAVLKQLDILSAQTIRDIAQQLLHELVPQSLPDEEKRVRAEKILNDPEFSRMLALSAATDVLGPEVMEALGMGGGPQESGRGGFGERQTRTPASTLPSQQPGMPGGNTQPGVGQRQREMMGGLAGEIGQAGG